MEHLNALAEQAAPVLSRRLGERVALDAPVVLKDTSRGLVVRCRVHSARFGITSVILKQIRDDAAVGFSDWASLAFLEEIPESLGLVPRFLGGDVSAPFFLMEDLGDSRSLQDLLDGDDRDTAESALKALAAQMARLHAATQGGEGTYETLRSGLPAADGLGRRREADRWLGARNRIDDWLEAAGCSTPTGFAACLERIAETFAEPGQFLCFTHGDPAPTNNHVDADGQVRLLDFEYGAFRHALYDLTGWNILCPLPHYCVQQMSLCFRSELEAACPIVVDEAAYCEAWGHLCAYRALAILTWIDPSVLQENRPRVGAEWTARHAVLAAVSRMHAATVGVSALDPVCEAAGALASALRRRWPEFENALDVATGWPALAGERRCSHQTADRPRL